MCLGMWFQVSPWLYPLAVHTSQTKAELDWSQDEGHFRIHNWDRSLLLVPGAWEGSSLVRSCMNRSHFRLYYRKIGGDLSACFQVPNGTLFNSSDCWGIVKCVSPREAELLCVHRRKGGKSLGLKSKALWESSGGQSLENLSWRVKLTCLSADLVLNKMTPDPSCARRKLSCWANSQGIVEQC